MKSLNDIKNKRILYAATKNSDYIGLYYTNYFELEGVLDYIFSHDREYGIMCGNARDYIDKNYRWDVIINNFKEVINSI